MPTGLKLGARILCAALALLSGGATAQTAQSAEPDSTVQFAQTFQMQTANGYILKFDRSYPKLDAGRYSATPFGWQLQPVRYATLSGWALASVLNEYRIRDKGLSQALILAEHILTKEYRQIVLRQLGYSDMSHAETPKAFTKFFKTRDEFDRADFIAFMKAQYAQSLPFDGSVRILNFKRLTLGGFNTQTNLLQISGLSTVGPHRDTIVSGIRPFPRSMAWQRYKVKSGLPLNPATAKEFVRSLTVNARKRREIYLAVTGVLDFPTYTAAEIDAERSGVVRRKATKFTPEFVTAYYDPEMRRPIPGLDLATLFDDLQAEQDRAAQQQANAQAEAAAQQQAEQRRKEAERVANEAKQAEAEALAQTRQTQANQQRVDSLRTAFGQRSLSILGLRLGMSVEQATAALKGSKSNYQITTAGNLPISIPQSCGKHRSEATRRATAAMQQAIDGGAARDDVNGRRNVFLEDAYRGLDSSCVPDDAPFVKVLTARASLGGQVDDEVNVFAQKTGGKMGGLVAVTRDLHWRGVTVDVEKNLAELLGPERISFRGRVYWIDDPQIHAALEQDEQLRKDCLPVSPWPFTGGGMGYTAFRASCGTVLGTLLSKGWASIALVDSTHAFNASTKATQAAREKVDAVKSKIEF